MASLKTMLVSLAIMGIAISQTLATEYTVGDEAGWTLNVDYQKWADSKQFMVGDKLVFKYSVGVHNVVNVDTHSLQACVVPIEAETLVSGNEVIELKTQGTQSYICSVGKHCEVGKMKFTINVWPQTSFWAPAPAPALEGSHY